MPRLIKRIVCLSATGLDVLLELGLEPIGYLSQGIAGRPEFFGERARCFTDMGAWLLPDVWAIYRSQPDLILGWSFPHRFYQPLLTHIAPVYLMAGVGYKAAIGRLRKLATILGREEAGEQSILALDLIGNWSKTLDLLGKPSQVQSDADAIQPPED